MNLADCRPWLIGIAGPSGAGKSWLSHHVAEALGAPILSLDSYYRELGHLPLEERARSNFDVPDALDEPLLTAHLTALADGCAIEKPVYDFARHTRAPEVERVEPGAFVIVEGLFALYWESVRAVLGTRVYVAAKDEICFERRLDRDVRERGRTPESVLTQYRRTVRPMAERFIYPTRQFADVVVSGTDPIERSVAAVLARINQSLAPDGSPNRLTGENAYPTSPQVRFTELVAPSHARGSEMDSEPRPQGSGCPSGAVQPTNV